MNDEYISREATVKAFCEKCKGYYDGHCIHRGECDIDVIKTAPAADVQPVKHGKWIESKKHIWYKKPNGDIDFFAYSEGHCNGVICKKCGEYFCVYCNPLYNEENCERQHYICSECSSTSMEKKKFCPDCGARMDGDSE